MFSAALYARVHFLFLPLAHETAGAARIRHSLLPRLLGDNDRQTSGVMRRENADVYLVFENRIEKLVVPDKRATRALIRDLYAVTPMATGSASELVEASRSDNR